MSFLEERLATLREAGTYRDLPGSVTGVDFWSNDYLGFAREREDSMPSKIATHTGTGSRLIAGDADAYQQLERRIAAFHGYPAALVFGSGYLANLGLLSALGRRTDTIFYDELIHASLRDGIRLSQARGRRFRHNDYMHLGELLGRARPDGQHFVVTEGRFSMDGDPGDVAGLAVTCQLYGAHLIVDEAHSVGVDGPGGRGLVARLGAQDGVFSTVVTYGKAPGFHGAAVLGSQALIDYLVNVCRPFIYTTGPSPAFWSGLARVYDGLETEQAERAELLGKRVGFFRARAQNLVRDLSGDGAQVQGLSNKEDNTAGPIQIISLPGNERVLAAEAGLRSAGLLVKAIRSPTVAAGTERLRICIHSFNTEKEIERLVAELKKYVR